MPRPADSMVQSPSGGTGREMARRADRNRLASRTMQFASMCVSGASGAMLVMAGAEHVFAEPLAGAANRASKKYQMPRCRRVCVGSGDILL